MLTYLCRQIGHEWSETIPQDGNPFVTAFNEGRRSVWTLISRHLRESNEQLRQMADKAAMASRRQDSE